MLTLFMRPRAVPAHECETTVEAVETRAVKVGREFDGAKLASWTRPEVEHVGPPNEPIDWEDVLFDHFDHKEGAGARATQIHNVLLRILYIGGPCRFWVLRGGHFSLGTRSPALAAEDSVKWLAAGSTTTCLIGSHLLSKAAKSGRTRAGEFDSAALRSPTCGWALVHHDGR